MLEKKNKEREEICLKHMVLRASFALEQESGY